MSPEDEVKKLLYGMETVLEITKEMKQGKRIQVEKRVSNSTG
jgi:hypothetical protein